MFTWTCRRRARSTIGGPAQDGIYEPIDYPNVRQCPPGGVTGRGSKEFRERVPVRTVPPSVEYEPNDPHRVGRTRSARDVYAGSAGKASQPRHRRQPRWAIHTIPARLISRGHPGAGRNTIFPIHRASPGGRPHLSAPILSFGTAQARRSAIGYLRLRLKPAHRSCGFVQGAWWPRTDQLFTELPPLLAALAPRVGSVDRVIYDETRWAPQSLRLEFSLDPLTNMLFVGVSG